MINTIMMTVNSLNSDDPFDYLFSQFVLSFSCHDHEGFLCRMKTKNESSRFLK